MQYTAVIRTLGKAGEKYQQLLDSLAHQTIKPAAILVYIAEGYPIPKETIGVEQYVYVKKGMNHFNGAEALSYARERYAYRDGDIHRIKNQQQVIEAVVNKLLSDTVTDQDICKIILNN